MSGITTKQEHLDAISERKTLTKLKNDAERASNHELSKIYASSLKRLNVEIFEFEKNEERDGKYNVILNFEVSVSPNEFDVGFINRKINELGLNDSGTYLKAKLSDNTEVGSIEDYIYPSSIYLGHAGDLKSLKAVVVPKYESEECDTYMIVKEIIFNVPVTAFDIKDFEQNDNRPFDPDMILLTEIQAIIQYKRNKFLSDNG